VDDLKRRLEMAISDVRELTEEGKRLKAELALAKSRPARAAESGGPLNWEEQKRRLLETLEELPEHDDEDSIAHRAQIENLIRDTDRAVAEKDQEIQDLKKLLDQQSTQVGEMVVGAQALAQFIDQDAFIQEERKRIQDTRTEWEEKLRQAEVEISLERAKLARERAQLDDRMRSLEAELSRRKPTAHSSTPESTKATKSETRRWLVRLGLKDDDSEPTT
jgi:hypothetical protein